ncbi:MAG: methyl-accepting chemotaxis protein [Archaeoglobus sp.]|uniref:methyl-accepting chemotaxis protein n=1 Tax=Archaeoglobus sp. TaxID=1872626 RepID=UPI001DD0402C|nr:methyl-accepting chemotaxis protein [Archaeoglobus sp.]MBO8181008.1 methyl-accepting chemotaxis protein [Archaeoglobus sp.]
MSSVMESPEYGLSDDAFKELADAVSRLKRGDFSVKLPAEKFSGDVAATFEEFNSFIDDMRALFAEILRVSGEAARGNLDVKADVTAYGEFAKLVENINNLTDAIVLPIREGIEVIKSYAQGDFTRKVRKDVKMEGEFAAFRDALDELGESMRKFIGEMGRTGEENATGMKQIKEAVDQINAGMEQISAASQQMAQGAANLSRIANETAAEAKNVVENIKKLTDEAKISAEFAKKTAENAELAEEEGRRAQSSMEEIIKEMNAVADIVKELDTAVKNIDKVSEKIKSIADQTNLLALNAAIEAARAGEHGRGFAVVADEVRKLAEESRKSTEEITEIIKMVLSETQKVTEATKRAYEQSETGSKEVLSALKRSAEIGNMVREIEKRLAVIVKQADEGYARVEQIARNIDEVASTAEESAASAEETSAAIEEQTAAVEEITASVEQTASSAEQTLKIIDDSFRI